MPLRLLPFVMVVLLSGGTTPVVREVGPGRAYATPAEALAAAGPGDTVLVHPPAGGGAWERVALLVRTPRLVIRAAPDRPGVRVRLGGAGFDYSGEGPVPRAIVQFGPGADHGTLEGFELSGARNGSHNGAGLRIDRANGVTVRGCDIHDCDMGIMSNGDGTPATGADQLVESCLVHHNGSTENPGFNHNLYLGGTSVTLRACEIHSSVTGHNVKSRAHLTRVEYCYVHDSANREFDLVDAEGDTTTPGSDAVLLGNLIVKDPACTGNRSVIHFGQDGGADHAGRLHLVHDTIVTPYASPVVDLDAPGAGAVLVNDIVAGDAAGGEERTLVRLTRGAAKGAVSGEGLWLAAGYLLPEGTALRGVHAARPGEAPPFADLSARDFHLARADPAVVRAGLPWAGIHLPGTPGPEEPPLLQCRFPLGTEARPGFRSEAKGDLGAFGWSR